MSLGTGVPDGYESPREFRELNSRLLKRQPVLLTTKPSLQNSYSEFPIFATNLQDLNLYYYFIGEKVDLPEI